MPTPCCTTRPHSCPCTALLAAQAATKKQKYEKISEKKMKTSFDTLCKGFPPEFVQYFQYVRSLRFDDKPDYSFLRRMFRDLFAREGGWRAGWARRGCCQGLGGLCLSPPVGLAVRTCCNC
jgi:hypothetical protein